MGRLILADFHTVYGFRRPSVKPLEGSRQVCGLDYPFSVLRKIRGNLKVLPESSQNYTFPASVYSGLGSGLRSLHRPFPASIQDFLQSAAYAIPARARRFPESAEFP